MSRFIEHAGHSAFVPHREELRAAFVKHVPPWLKSERQ